MQQLMQWQRDIIINSMVSKSSAEISVLLGIDKNIITDFICANCGSIVTKDQKIAERNVMRDQKPTATKKKKEKPRITSARITPAATAPYKPVQRKYKNIEHNFSLLIPVKIDHKTYIYIKPGQDAQAVKEKYLKRLLESQNFSIGPNHSKEVKKFKP